MSTDQAVVSPREPMWLLTWTFILIAAVPLVGLGLSVLLNPFAAFVWALSISATAGCVVLLVWLSPRPLRWRTAIVPAAMGLFAGLAPVSFVVFGRLLVRSCIVLDVLGLSALGSARDVVFILSALVCVGAGVLVVAGLFAKQWRWAAISMIGWGAVSVVPMFFLFFFSVYGDPGPDCIPV